MEDGIVLVFGKTEMGRETIKRTADDKLAGYSLGRLLLRHRQGDPFSISEAQFQTAEEWRQIVIAHANLHGYKLTVHSPSFSMVGGFGQNATEADKEKIERIRRQWCACYEVIKDPIRLRNIIFGIVVEDWPLNTLYPDDYGLLREGLNAIARALR